LASQEQIDLLMRRMKATWPHWKLVNETPGEYMRLLAPIPDDLLSLAYDVVARSDREYPPPPGVLYSAATRLVDQAPSVAAGWSLALLAASGRKVTLPRIVRRVVEETIGGVGALGRLDESELPSHRARFMTAYQKELERRDWQVAAQGPLMLMEGEKET